jgi:hypothetical protein
MLSEEVIINHIEKLGGLCITRFVNNEKTVDLSQVQHVVLTGADQLLYHFFEDVDKKIPQPYNLVIVESDRYELFEEWLDNSKVNQVYGWNQRLDHHKIYPLPIGINEKRMGETLRSYDKKTPTKLMFVNFNFKTNPHREPLYHKLFLKFGGCPSVTFQPYKNEVYRKDKSSIEGEINQQVTQTEYYDMLTDHKFCVSPPGTGVDCHRHWECLYLGIIPIIQSDKYLDPIYERLPVLIVKDWSVLTKKYLQKKYKLITERLKKGYYDLELLDVNYWKNIISTV